MKHLERIKALREDSDKSQNDIAKLLNVGQKTYSDYELGKTRIPFGSIIILAKYYNVDINYISGISNIRNEYPKE